MDIPQQNGRQIALAYEKDYEIEDEVLAEPFVVLKPISDGRPRWWRNRKKVEALINAFKMDLLIEEAIIRAGITYGQYRYFCEVHPDFLQVKARCKKYSEIVAKQALLGHLRNPKDAQTVRWFLERKQPGIYGQRQNLPVMPPNAAAKVTAEAFLDEDGNVIISKQTAEYLEEMEKEEHEPH